MKLKSIRILNIFFGSAVLFNACKHELPVLPSPLTPSDATNGNNTGGGNNGGNGNGGTTVTCDPDTVYFQNDILPLFVTKCAMNNCHNSQSHQEGIILDSYINIIGTADVRAYDPNHGKVYELITESDLDDRMPPTPLPALSSAETNKILRWINQGALNNVCNASAGGGCDTSNVTYAGIIAPLLQSKCTGCHNSTSTGGGINLTTYQGVHTVAVNGHLFGAVNRSAGFFAMPKNLPKLPDCQIAQIRIWIQNGSLNN